MPSLLSFRDGAENASTKIVHFTLDQMGDNCVSHRLVDTHSTCESRCQASLWRLAEYVQSTDSTRQQQHRHHSRQARPTTLAVDWSGEFDVVNLAFNYATRYSTFSLKQRRKAWKVLITAHKPQTQIENAWTHFPPTMQMHAFVSVTVWCKLNSGNLRARNFEIVYYAFMNFINLSSLQILPTSNTTQTTSTL